MVGQFDHSAQHADRARALDVRSEPVLILGVARLEDALVAGIKRGFTTGEEDPGTSAMLDAVIGELPLRGLVANSGGKLSLGVLGGLLRALNLGRGSRKR